MPKLTKIGNAHLELKDINSVRVNDSYDGRYRVYVGVPGASCLVTIVFDTREEAEHEAHIIADMVNNAAKAPEWKGLSSDG